jgi:hypothetical protein
MMVPMPLMTRSGEFQPISGSENSSADRDATYMANSPPPMPVRKADSATLQLDLDTLTLAARAASSSARNASR